MENCEHDWQLTPMQAASGAIYERCRLCKETRYIPGVRIKSYPTREPDQDQILFADCLDMLRGMPDNSVDAIVTDPPSGISFMGKKWDDPQHIARRVGLPKHDCATCKLLKGEAKERHIEGAYFTDWLALVMREANRVLKPGGYALVWALPRTSHWTAKACEDAGFLIDDIANHIFGSGFPKSLDISKAIDKELGKADERKVVGMINYHGTVGKPEHFKANLGGGSSSGVSVDKPVTAPATAEAEDWQGFGTALKPAVEHWILAQKPISEKSIAANVLKWGTGGLNIDGTRIGYQNIQDRKKNDVKQPGMRDSRSGFGGGMRTAMQDSGRWPAHLLLSHSIFCVDGVCSDDCPVKAMGDQSGVSASPGNYKRSTVVQNRVYGASNERTDQHGHADIGTAARYFAQFTPDSDEHDPIWHYFSKPSPAERDAGCEDLPMRASADVTDRAPGSAGALNARSGATHHGARNHHPTVKSIALMRWLVKLVARPGQVVLDLFGGSGTTAVACVYEGVRFIVIEGDFGNDGYVPIIEARVAYHRTQAQPVFGKIKRSGKRPKPAKVVSLFDTVEKTA